MPKDYTPSSLGTETAGYSGFAQALHWLTALLIFATLPVAWVMGEMAKDNPERGFAYMIHKSLGVTIFAIVIARLLWRAISPAPPLPGHLAGWEARGAKTTHALLYIVLLVMPISGYITSAASNHAVSFFGLFALPLLPENKDLAEAAGEVHEAAQWALYALVALHVLATSWHVGVRRDGALHRMLPEQVNAPARPTRNERS
jgi:cytochrome b561